MDEMLNQMFGKGKYMMYVEVPRPRRPKEDPVVQVEVELLFRPHLPALAVAHPTGHSILLIATYDATRSGKETT